ncbi:arsenite methyltransferase [Calditrichota bacterium]
METHTRKADEIKDAVRDLYAKAADGGGCGCSTDSSCCGDTAGETFTEGLGYTADELKTLPAGADLGLGCGNPGALASLNPGETVLDLGSGGGIDCFIAANRVGETGHVIGVDMTPQMITKARANAEKSGFKNVEFRLGEIEHIPVADQSVDVIMSNCVINLAPDKLAVYKDAYRVLKPGGRLAISDIVAIKPLPDSMRQDLELHAGCIAGALTVEELEDTLNEAGFINKQIGIKSSSHRLIDAWQNEDALETYVRSADITAQRPGAMCSCCS